MITVIIVIVWVVLVYIFAILNTYVTEKRWRKDMEELYGPKDFGQSLIRTAFTLGLIDPKRKR